jgi:hypothetical protein
VHNLDGGATNNDVLLQIIPAPGTDRLANFRIQRAPVTPVGACGPGGGADPLPGSAAFVDIGTARPSSFEDRNVPDGCHTYRAIAVNPRTSAQSPPGEPTPPVAIPG